MIWVVPFQVQKIKIDSIDQYCVETIKLTNKKGGALSVRTQSKKKDAKGMKKMGTYFKKKSK